MKELDPALTYAIIGDPHMKMEKLQAILDKCYLEVDHYIILGDWQDDFPPTQSTAEETADMLKHCLLNPQVFTCLWGNHDTSYYNPGQHSCAGWQPDRQAAMADIPWDRFHLGAYITSVEPERNHWLFTHAGLSQRWFRDATYLPITPNLVEVIAILEQAEADLKAKVFNPFLEGGMSRGGRQAVGGVLWADWSELDAISGIRQIVGHTPQADRQTKFKGTSICIDNYMEQIVILNVEEERIDIEECV